MFKFHTGRLGSSEQVTVSAAEAREHRSVCSSWICWCCLLLPSQSCSNSYLGDLSHNCFCVQKGRTLCPRAGLEASKVHRVSLVCTGREMDTGMPGWLQTGLPCPTLNHLDSPKAVQAASLGSRSLTCN